MYVCGIATEFEFILPSNLKICWDDLPKIKPTYATELLTKARNWAINQISYCDNFQVVIFWCDDGILSLPRHWEWWHSDNKRICVKANCGKLFSGGEEIKFEKEEEYKEEF